MKKSAFKKFFLESTFFKTKDEKREMNGGEKKVVIFFGGLEVFYYFCKIIPNCGAGEKGILMIVYNLIYEILYRKT